MEQNVVLKMRDISKNFTGVRALSHVDFTLRRGEVPDRTDGGKRSWKIHADQGFDRRP